VLALLAYGQAEVRSGWFLPASCIGAADLLLGEFTLHLIAISSNCCLLMLQLQAIAVLFLRTHKTSATQDVVVWLLLLLRWCPPGVFVVEV
jgi:hypothetical protein